MKLQKDYLLIIMGSAAMAVSVNSIFEPMGMVTGGFSGIAIVVKALSETLIPGGIPLGLTTAVLNLPLFLVCLRIKGFAFLKRSLVGMLSLSVWLSVLPTTPLIAEDRMLGALWGGVLQGAGLGLVFAGRGTTGGTDMAAALLQTRLPWWSTSQIMQLLDWLVVIWGALVFGFSRIFYTLAAIFIVAKVSDGIIEGLKFSKAAFIITEKHEAIGRALLQEAHRGATGISVRGMYSGQGRMMLLCVVSRRQIVEVKEIVQRIDANAFVIVADVREVLGEGF